MNKRVITIIILLAAVLVASVSVALAQPLPKKGVPLKGVVRVKLQGDISDNITTRHFAKAKTFAAGASGSALQVGVKSIDLTLKQIGGVSIRKLFPCSPEREAEHRKFGLDKWYEITFDQTVSPLEARSLLQNTAGIESAEVRVPMQRIEGGEKATIATEAGMGNAQRAPKKKAGETPFNDPRLHSQWHYTNDGSMPGSVPGADINLFKAWQISTGSPKVVVAVIDGGIDFNHEDLAANMYINEKELNGTPGVDDDGNGYIDDIYGYNFCTNSGTIYPHNHGTHVAGTVSAVNNNGIGVCGVAGGDGSPGSGVKLMSCQVYDSRQSVGDGDFAAALIYAADNGATLAQCSWGWAEDGYYETPVLDAVRYFTKSARSNNMAGGLCIFAAGNEAITGQIYPACMEEVVAVAAMNYDLIPSPYSNYGTWVDVTAPGGYLDYDQAQGILSTLPNNSYGYMEGTSMATPHVTGVAALVLSKYGAPTLINESVRQQLVTSVNDFYTKNPLAKGLFGEGYIDAYKALQWGDGTPPEAVSDLEVIAMQESATLTWTIPNSSSKNVNSHILYYSDKPFTEATLSEAKAVVIDTKFCTSGDKFTYEVENLLPLTTYYFALKAVDRWSTASQLSPLVSVTTNAGPDMTISRTSMTLSTTDGSTWNSRTFDISNKGEGLLKWSTNVRTTSSAIRAYSKRKAQQASGSDALISTPYSGKVTVMPTENSTMPGSKKAEAKAAVIQDLEAFEQEDYPKYMENHKGVYAFIGDNEKSNSLAQLFRVTEEEFPEGFNLTHVYMQGSYGKHPVFEIYKAASSLKNATLLERYDAGEDATPYYVDHSLPECLYFAPGESFYIVVHFEDFTTRNYPLPLALDNGKSTYSATHAYMSNDKGTTWTLLSEVLKGTAYESVAEQATWAVTAKSYFPDWSQVLTLSPAEGQLKSGGTQTVTVGVSKTPLPNGTYKTKVLFNTNESKANDLYVNATLVVEGQKPNVSFNKIVEFGNLIVGQSKTLTIEVFNKGYGAFAGGDTYAGLFGDKIKSTSEHFHGPTSIQNGLPARSTTTIDLTYTPTSAGNHSGVIIFTDKNGTQLRVNVTGSATDPAKIVVDPATINVGTLNATDKEVKSVKFDIKNEGNYPMQWVMPKFSSETFEGVTSSSTHRFGYVWQSNLYGSSDVKYDGVPQLIDAVDITKEFGDYKYFSSPIDIGFDFPFYGKNYRQLYVSSLGVISFEPYTVGTIYSPLYPSSTYLAGLGVISAYGFEFQIAPTTKVEYAKQNGKLVVNFSNVLVPVYGTEGIPASFHVSLSPSGDIDIAFDDYDPETVFEKGRNLWVGIVDKEQEDELTMTSSEMTSDAYWYGDQSEEANRWRYVKSGTVFRIIAPKPNLIAEIEPAYGIVTPGDKVEITAKVKATDEMYAGDTYTDLVIQSNDLKTPTKLVRFNATIVGDLYPIFAISKEELDFGTVFATSTAQQTVSVQNKGRSPLTLKSVWMGSNKFTHDFTQQVDIPAGQSKDITITLNTYNQGTFEGVMTITTSDGEKNVKLKGRVTGVPEIALGYESVKETLAAGETKALPLTIENKGDQPLRYSIEAGNHLSYSPEYSEGSATEYRYVSSLDDATALRDWYDIETTGLGQQYNYTNFLKKDIIVVDLPFEFTYFNKKYKRMYVYDSGFVSFTYYRDEGVWPEPPSDFPQGSLYKNVIAPYWGLHTMDITSTAGIFCYKNDDMAVVSWIEYGNSMNIGIDFQLIIRKDGTFTFNYKPANDYAVLFGTFGLTGICDENGNGFKLADRYIALNSSMNFMPIVENTLEPGAKYTADVKFLADDMAGTYQSSILINTNIPTKPKVEIPVNLTITGEAKPVFPEDKTVEQVAEYIDTETKDELMTLGAFWYIPIEIANNGSAPFTITAINVESPKYEGNDIFTLYWYGQYVDSWSGALVNGWSPYAGKPITVGRGVTKFALPLWGNDFSQFAWQTPGDYNVKLTLKLQGLEGITTKTVNILCRITEQPKLALDKDEIRLKANNDDFVSVETLNISNKDGKYPLRYTVTVDPTGIGEAPPQPSPSGEGDYNSPAIGLNNKANQNPLPLRGEVGRGLVPAEAPDGISFTSLSDKAKKSKRLVSPTLCDVGKSDFLYNAPQADVLEHYQMDYLRALYWPGREDQTVMYNYGTSTKWGTYKAATGFVGPEGGFNISHIYFCMHPYGLDYKDVEFEIYNGDPQSSTDVIGHGTFHLGEVTKTPQDDYQNNLGICQLDRPVYISEGQVFYVVITFPTGQEYPASIIYKQEAVVSNRYLGFADDYGWFDVSALFSESYGSLGYLCTCLETVEGDAWVKLLTPDGEKVSTLSGEVAKGETKALQVRVSAAEAPKETGNKAVLIIKSNDPKQTVTNFPVYLDKTSSPVVSLGTSSILVSEGEQITLTATVTDVDGDLESVTLSNSMPFASIAKETVISATERRVDILIAPDYGHEGVYTLMLKAADKQGHASTASAKVTVLHSNRPPQFVAIDNVYVQTGLMSQLVNLTKLFTDPDDTELTYDISVSDERIAKMFRSGNEVMFRGMKQGNATATVSCTDASGAVGTGTFRVFVRDDLSAISSAETSSAGIRVEGDQLVVSTGDVTGDVSVAIFTPDGQKVAAAAYVSTPTQSVHRMNIASLPQGTYIINVRTAEGSTTLTVIIS